MEIKYFHDRSDTYTVAGNGAVVGTTFAPPSQFGIQVVGTGAAATAWNVVLEGSLDGVSFENILTHTNTTGNNRIVYSGATQYPSRFFRSRCVSITLGSATDIVVFILGI